MILATSCRALSMRRAKRRLRRGSVVGARCSASLSAKWPIGSRSSLPTRGRGLREPRQPLQHPTRLQSSCTPCCSRGGVLDLDWLDLLEGHAVVDHETLQKKGARAAAASKIVGKATRIERESGGR